LNDGVCVGIYLVHPQKPEGDIYTHAVPIYLRDCRLLGVDTRPLFIKSGGSLLHCTCVRLSTDNCPGITEISAIRYNRRERRRDKSKRK
jgi:hypothetical protein